MNDRKISRSPGTDRAWIEVNLQNLRHNVAELQRIMPADCRLMAVVKAESYGHGSYEIAVCLGKIGVSAFAVATLEEGIALRRYGIGGEILILGYTDPSRAKELHRYKLTQTIVDYDHAVALEECGYHIKTHIKIDTGMHRLGFDATDVEKILSVFSMRHIRIDGIYTHLCVSDSLAAEDVRFTRDQIHRFYGLLEQLKEEDIVIPKVHIQSSYGLLNYPDLRCDYARIGIALYGVLSSPDARTKMQPDLRPVLSLRARVTQIRTVERGDSVGYGRAHVTDRESKIAVVSAGYADGVPRVLSCRGNYVLIRGMRAPLMGKICMDQMMADVTDIPDIAVGEVATLIGRDGKEEILAQDVADRAESITNELLCRMGRRLKVISV